MKLTMTAKVSRLSLAVSVIGLTRWMRPRLSPRLIMNSRIVMLTRVSSLTLLRV